MSLREMFTLEAVRLSNGTLIAAHPYLPAGHPPVWLPDWGVKGVRPALYAAAKKRIGTVEVPFSPTFQKVDWKSFDRLFRKLRVVDSDSPTADEDAARELMTTGSVVVRRNTPAT